MKGKLLNTAMFLILVFGIAGCQSGNNQEGDQEKSDTAKNVQDTTKTTDQDNEGVATLLSPSPIQIASIFHQAGLSYVSGVTHKPEKASEYISRSARLLNIGVYSSDFSYCILNDQSQKAGKYLKTIKKLTEKVGMTGVFKSNRYFERFEQNTGNQDSIIGIMEEVQVSIDAYIQKNELQDQSTVIFAGSWVEAMHIGMKAIENNDNQKLKFRVVEQLTILENLLSNLKAQSNKSAELKELIVQLEKLNERFDAFVKGKKQASKADQEISIEFKELEGLSKEIEGIRKHIIQAQ